MNDARTLHRVLHAALATALALGLGPSALGVEPSGWGARFDHHETGFPLTGAHRTARCDTCHSRGVFKGTPRLCTACHVPGSGRATTARSARHIPTHQPCDQCHDTRRFAGARFDHSAVIPGGCVTCHSGAMAKGKPANHMITSAACDTCHSTRAFRPAIGVDHSTVVPGTCATCHNGSSATGKSSGHFVTTLSCDACHTTARWNPVTRYSHTSALFPGQHDSDVTCRDCHTTNAETVAWPMPSLRGFCAGCHYNDFERDEHKKTATTYYTPDELPDCAGSCHLYDEGTVAREHSTRDF